MSLVIHNLERICSPLFSHFAFFYVFTIIYIFILPENLKKQWFVFNNHNLFCGWCCSDYSNIDGITGFSEEDSQSVFSFMKSALQLAKSGDGQVIFFGSSLNARTINIFWNQTMPQWSKKPMYDTTKPRFSQL